jgi:hypothetical protein
MCVADMSLLGVEAELLQQTTSDQQADAVRSGVVGQTDRQTCINRKIKQSNFKFFSFRITKNKKKKLTVSWQLMSVCRNQCEITTDFGVNDLYMIKIIVRLEAQQQEEAEKQKNCRVKNQCASPQNNTLSKNDLPAQQYLCW